MFVSMGEQRAFFNRLKQITNKIMPEGMTKTEENKWFSKFLVQATKDKVEQLKKGQSHE